MGFPSSFSPRPLHRRPFDEAYGGARRETNIVNSWRGCVQGRRCPAAFIDAALHAADGFVKYENVLLAPDVVQEGQEPDELLSLLETGSEEEHSNQVVEECAAYSRDYQVQACRDLLYFTCTYLSLFS